MILSLFSNTVNRKKYIDQLKAYFKQIDEGVSYTGLLPKKVIEISLISLTELEKNNNS